MASNERTRFSLPAALVVGALLIVFAVLSYSAVLTKSPTIDEPVHLTAAYISRFLEDHRSNPEHPVLWKYWATIFLGRDDLRIDTTSAIAPNHFGELGATPWPNMLTRFGSQFETAHDSLFGSHRLNTDKVFASARLAMVLLGVILGAFVAAWAGRLGGSRYGAPAAVIAAAFFAFDPNMLAHSPLVTNDIALTLAFALVAWAVWLVGRRLTAARAGALGLACAVAINIKYSAVLCGPIVATLLLVRALLPTAWPAMGQIVLRSRLSRLAAVIVLGAICVGASILVTWAVYGMRFGPSKDPRELFDTKLVFRILRQRDHGTPMEEPLKPDQLSRRVRAIAWVEEHRLLPQAYTYGMLRFEQFALERRSYLCGQYSTTGWWYYYPAAILFKTPLATLALGGLAVAAAGLAFRRRSSHHGDHGGHGEERKISEDQTDPSSPCHLATLSPCHSLRTLLCLLLPPAAYLAVSMASAFNIGIRHIFPIYPFLMIGVALALAWLWGQKWRWARGVMLLLLIALAAETTAGYPHYIAFFNQACGGYQRGGRYLVDSNLDWGQDLKLLAEWQSHHPDETLYLCYFGLADPQFYQINHIAMPAGFWRGDSRVKAYLLDDPPPAQPGWLAISANFATGALLSPEERAYYRKLADLEKPDEILGGSIYLYRYPKGR